MKTNSRLDDERLRSIIELAPIAMMLVDQEGRMNLVNFQVEHIFGYERNELLGQTVELLVPERFRSGHPALRTNFFRQPAARSLGVGRDLFGRRKDGSEILIEIGLNPIHTPEGMMVLAGIVDITEKRKKEQLFQITLAQLEAQKKALDQFAIVAETDAKGKITYVNNQFCKVSKYSREELIGKDHRDVANSGYHPKEFWCGFWATIQAGKIWRGDVCNKAKDGTLYWEDTTIVPFLGKEGMPEKYLAIRANITDRKLAEEKNQEIARLKSEFASMVSHELRTPLTAIKGGLSIVYNDAAGNLSANQKHFLEISDKNIDRLTRLVNNVLDYQKLQSGLIEFNMTETDLNELVTNTMKDFEPIAANKNLKLKTELQADLPKCALDGDKITQVLTNLLNNAVKFSEKGTITIKTARWDPNAVRVSVEDEGAGIEEKDLPKLFQTFSQITNQANLKKGGSGLGLAISKGIVEGYGGRIGVESAYGKGSTFYFILPLAATTELKP